MLTPEELQRTLAIPDLTDAAAHGTHAINLMMDRMVRQLEGIADYPPPEIRRRSPVVPIADNFDRLYFPADNVGRQPRYTRYVSHTQLLRTHTSSMIPDLLLERPVADDRLLVCPGLCYRRDVVDRTHVGEMHQMDIWRIKRGDPPLRREALIQLVETVVHAIMPGGKYRANETNHPYTINGLEVEIWVNDSWLEILECGEAHPQLLEASGLPPNEYSGLAMGVGLERLVMVLKKLPDIRLLRAADPRIARQMTDLEPYIPVSNQPMMRRDMSIATDPATTIEDLCEQMQWALGQDVDVLEEVTVLFETPASQLPPIALERIGMTPQQKNMLVRVVLRSVDRTLTTPEANDVRNRIYLAIHQGTVKTLAT